MPKQLSDYHEALRTLLGDDGDSIGGYDYHDERLDAALRSVVNLGYLPCVRLDVTSGTPPTALESDPVHADTNAYLVVKAAHLLSSPAAGGMASVRTRAISVTVQPMALRDNLFFIESLLAEIDERGNVCATAASSDNAGGIQTSQDVTTWAVMCRDGFYGGGAALCME